MVEFRIKIHEKQLLARIPRILARTFGFVWSIMPDTKAAVIYSEGTDLEDVIASLDILMQELRLQSAGRSKKPVVSKEEQSVNPEPLLQQTNESSV